MSSSTPIDVTLVESCHDCYTLCGFQEDQRSSIAGGDQWSSSVLYQLDANLGKLSNIMEWIAKIENRLCCYRLYRLLDVL